LLPLRVSLSHLALFLSLTHRGTTVKERHGLNTLKGLTFADQITLQVRRS